MNQQVRESIVGGVVGVVILAILVVVLSSPDENPAPSKQQDTLSAPEPVSTPDPAPTAEDDESETVTEHTVPAVCVDVIKMNEMLVVSGQDVYSDAINALVDGKVEGIREATEGLEAYHDLVSEVNKNYEKSRQECLGEPSDAEEAAGGE